MGLTCTSLPARVNPSTGASTTHTNSVCTRELVLCAPIQVSVPHAPTHAAMGQSEGRGLEAGDKVIRALIGL